MQKLIIKYKPIGLIRSEHIVPDETPIQPVYSKGHTGKVEIFPEYAEGLADLDGFSHVYLLYHLHLAGSTQLLVKPYLDDTKRGIFATRAPCRPNPIGLSIVELTGRQGNILRIDGIDIMDGTPLLDIKPYTARFDCVHTKRNGWLDNVDEETAKMRGGRGIKS